MPSELSNEEEFLKISGRASECRVKRLKDKVKLKLRTPGRLYTMVVDPEKASDVLKQIKCEVVEV